MSFTNALKIFLQYQLSSFLWLVFNPMGLVQTLRQAIGQCIAIVRSISAGVQYDETAVFALPLEGTWKAVNGGVHKQTSHSWDLIAQRYAYDFVVTDEAGKTHRQKGHRPEDYFAFGKPILAAGDGIVVQAQHSIRDYPQAGSGWIDIKTPDIRGNYVVIQHGPALYTLYAHLRAGSIQVQPGQTVVRGQKIGECGHSGHSSEPHLHFQLQDRMDFYTAVGLPVRFMNFEREQNGVRECVEQGFVERDQIVHAVDACARGITESVEFVRPSFKDLVVNVFTLFLMMLGIWVLVMRLVEVVQNAL